MEGDVCGCLDGGCVSTRDEALVAMLNARHKTAWNVLCILTAIV